MLLKDILKIKPDDLLKALKNPVMLVKTGVMREKNSDLIPALTNYVKWLAWPSGRAPLMNSAKPEEPVKKKKPQLSEYERGRLLDRQKQLLSEMERKNPQLSEYEKRRILEKQKQMLDEAEKKRAERQRLLGPRGKQKRVA